MINKKLVSQHFSRGARDYDIYSHIQNKMARELVQYSELEKLNHVESILDIGCGTGNLSRQLMNLFPMANMTCMDIAGGMIDQCKKSFINSKAEFICADAEEYQHYTEYDIVASNAAFQWFNDVRGTLNKLKKSLKSEGVICFSTFGEKTFHELHMSHIKALNNLGFIKKARPGQRFYRFDEIENILCDLFGEQYILRMKSRIYYCYFNSVKEFFHSVKKIGANNSNTGYRHKNPGLIKELIRIYENEYRVNDKIRVTYECIYCYLKKR